MLSRCREIMRNSPTALRILKAALNATEDGQAGIQGEAMSQNARQPVHRITVASACYTYILLSSIILIAEDMPINRRWAAMLQCCSTSQRKAMRQVCKQPLFESHTPENAGAFARTLHEALLHEVVK